MIISCQPYRGAKSQASIADASHRRRMARIPDDDRDFWRAKETVLIYIPPLSGKLSFAGCNDILGICHGCPGHDTYAAVRRQTQEVTASLTGILLNKGSGGAFPGRSRILPPRGDWEIRGCTHWHGAAADISRKPRRRMGLKPFACDGDQIAKHGLCRFPCIWKCAVELQRKASRPQFWLDLGLCRDGAVCDGHIGGCQQRCAVVLCQRQ